MKKKNAKDKKYFFWVLIFFYLIPVFFTSADSGKVGFRDKRQLISVQSKTNAIDKKNNLTKIKRNLMGRSSEGGELVGFYDDEVLKKISAEYFGEMGKIKTSYYFEDEKIFCVVEKRVFYDKPFYVNGFKVKKIEENKYYFFDKRLTSLVKDKKITNTDVTLLSELEKTINNDLQNYLELLSK